MRSIFENFRTVWDLSSKLSLSNFNGECQIILVGELISYRLLVSGSDQVTSSLQIKNWRLELIGRHRNNNELTLIKSVQRLGECKGASAFDCEP